MRKKNSTKSVYEVKAIVLLKDQMASIEDFEKSIELFNKSNDNYIEVRLISKLKIY